MNRIALSSIALVLANVASAQVAEVFNPSEPLVSVVSPLNPNSGVSPAGAPACGGQLFNNGAFVTSTGNGTGGANLSMLQSTSLGMATLGFGHQSGTANNRVADDFVVPAGGWTLNCAVFYAYQTGSTTTSTITAVNVRIWDGPPGAMGSNIVFGDTTTNRMTASAWTNAYRVTETSATDTTRPIMAQTINLGGLNLAAGTYWIDWQTTGSLASGPWAPPISIIGQAVTGNGQQFTGNTSAWAPAVDGGTGTPAQGLPFLLLGPVGTPTLSLSGTSIDFGSVVSGQTGSGSITLSNTGTANLSVTALTAPTAPFALTGGTCGATPITLAPAASCTLTYSFSPTSASPSNQSIAVTSNGGNPSFSLQGTGVGAPVAALSASALNFGNVAISAFGNATVTLSNTGGSALTISAVTPATAPFSANGGTCGAVPITLAAGANCTLIYRFSPSVSGSFSQTLTLTSNGGNPSFSLQGTGVLGAAPRPAVIPATGATSLILLALLTLSIAGWVYSRRH
jgi:hypothetical protein